MLKGKLKYIRHARIQGVSNKNQLPYDFANITLSDGDESFKLDLTTNLAETRLLQDLKKGTMVNIEVDVIQDNNRTQFIVSDILLDAKVG